MLRDRQVWAAGAVGVALRALPLWVWGWAGSDCTRDECIFKITARPILEGTGLGLAPKGWLPAPGFPYLLAACHEVLGSFEAVKWVHVALSLPTLFAFAALAARVHGPRAGRIMAWLFAVHPTFVFFAGTMWTETVYTFFLALTLLAFVSAREGPPWRAALAGVGLGLCVLNRGIATWLGPLIALGLLLPETPTAGWAALRDAALARWRHAVAFLAAAFLTVAPYSVAASARWGGFVVSDATLGHVIALGNDDYAPVTFDYMIGQLTGRMYTRTLQHGRRDCPRTGGPITHDRCEVQRAVAWIGEHPQTFLGRVPMRLAQLLNPHSFLTRHLRWDFWPGIPWGLKEALVAFQAAWTWLIVVGGTVAGVARGRGPFGVVGLAILLYYTALISALYGLTRFRLPIEPIFMVWLAAALAEPSQALQALRAEPARLGLALVLAGLLTWLMSWYAWTGWPGLG